MLEDRPLFWLEYHVVYWEGKSYLCEVRCWCDGVVEIMEMVELEMKNDTE